jgi:hypothetical protein
MNLLEDRVPLSHSQGLSHGSVMYTLRGNVNGVPETFEIGARPSVSGNTEVIMHHFFRPDPR